MHHLSVLFATILFGLALLAPMSLLNDRSSRLNGQYTGKASAPGVCIATKKCSSAGKNLSPVLAPAFLMISSAVLKLRVVALGTVAGLLGAAARL